jgi:hypothetical protein
LLPSPVGEKARIRAFNRLSVALRGRRNDGTDYRKNVSTRNARNCSSASESPVNKPMRVEV